MLGRLHALCTINTEKEHATKSSSFVKDENRLFYPVDLIKSF